jgi:hypothetical protein
MPLPQPVDNHARARVVGSGAIGQHDPRPLRFGGGASYWPRTRESVLIVGWLAKVAAQVKCGR